MIELIQQYGLAYLWTDGSGFSGVAMTLWLFIVSVILGFFLSIPWQSPASASTSGYAGRWRCTPTCFAARRCISSC